MLGTRYSAQLPHYTPTQHGQREDGNVHGVSLPPLLTQCCTASAPPETEAEIHHDLLLLQSTPAWGRTEFPTLTLRVSTSAGSGVGVFTDGGAMGDFTTTCWGCWGRGIPKAVSG